MIIPSEGLKKCKRCGKSKPLPEFRSKVLKPPRYRKETVWHNTLCRECDKAYHLEHYYKHHDRYKADGLRRKKAEDSKVRKAVFAHYGERCACCGETEPRFLSIDHINNDGNLFRKDNKRRSGIYIYRWIIKQGYPKDLQTLCMNCNHGKRMNGGICPHKQRVTTIP